MRYFIIRVAVATLVVYGIIALFVVLAQVIHMVLLIAGVIIIGAITALIDGPRLEETYREAMGKEE